MPERQGYPVRNILMAKSAPEVVEETNPSRVTTIIQRALGPLSSVFEDSGENKGVVIFVVL